MLWLALLSSPAAAAEATHCSATEAVIVSCAIGEKTVSICGGPKDAAPTWLQYRFGQIGAPELVYPANKEGSLSHIDFEHGTAMHSEWDAFDFTNEGHAYKVLFEVPFHGGSMAPEPFSGILVSKGGKELARLACTTPTVQNLEHLR